MSSDHYNELKEVAFHGDLWTLSLNSINNEYDLKTYIGKALEEKAQKLSYPFVIYDKINNKIAGSTRFGNINLSHKRLEIGWTWIGKDFQKTGINTSCKYLLLEYAFEQLNAQRVELKTDVLNENSRRAILRIGAKQEAILKNHLIAESKRVRDSVYFSIISQEWEQIKLKFQNELLYD